jgi:AcrR family transcriptional regulator
MSQATKAGERASYANGQRRRAEIVDAATTVFATEGFRRLSLRQIAEEIGTNHVSLKYHFGSKDGLLEAVLARREENEGPWREQLLRERGFLDGTVEVMRRNAGNRGLIQLDTTLQAEATTPDHPAHEFIRRREELFFASVLEQLQLESGRGHLRDGLDLAVVARQFIALVEGIQVQWLYDETVDMAAHVDAFMDYLRSSPRSTGDDAVDNAR